MTANATALQLDWDESAPVDSAMFDPLFDQTAEGVTRRVPRGSDRSHLRLVSQYTPTPRVGHVPTTGSARSRWAIFGALMVATVAMFLWSFSSGAIADSAPQQTVSHVVQPGDTLWTLATELTGPGGDVRATVIRIREANGMSNSMLMVGDQIEIPTGR